LPRESEVGKEMLVIGKIVQGGTLPAQFRPAQQSVQERGPSRP
jgi:hypothetical protein